MAAAVALTLQGSQHKKNKNVSRESEFMLVCAQYCKVFEAMATGRAFGWLLFHVFGWWSAVETYEEVLNVCEFYKS